MESQGDDPRHTELETLEAIYPEIRRLGGPGSFCFQIDLPVQPASPVTVTFPAALGNDAEQGAGNGALEVDSLQVSHLPSLSLQISLPVGYPSDHPPSISIFTKPQWLPTATISKLEDDGPRLWEESGRDLVAYSFIDHVQRAADDVFGTITEEGTLQIDAEHKLAVLDHDIKAKKEAFERETFDCGVCLDPKEGSQCHKMLDCGHIFCLQCLQDFYNDAIEEGSLTTVRCLSPNCAKDRATSRQKLVEDGPSRKTRVKTFISPSELLQIGLSEEKVKRYVTLKHKTQLESDKSTVYCPRQWCSGAARSKKHKKPLGLEFEDMSDQDSGGGETAEEEEREEKRREKKPKFNVADLLAVCEDCGLAFCRRCLQPWHGEFVRCTPKRRTEELTEEEKASLEYLQLHTSPCPTCGAPAQKTHGCNHMICSRCDTHFCYLCSCWLDPSNPYRHYNQQPDGRQTSCYMRLWELEEGDGGDVGLGFGGGPGLPLELVPIEPIQADIEGDESGSDVEEIVNAGRGLQQQHGPNEQQVAVAREAPLVLRLNPGRPAERRAAPEIPPAQRPDRGAPQHGNLRGQVGGGRARRGRGAGRAARARGGPRRGNGAAPAAGQHPQRQLAGPGAAGLDAAQEAWVRHFVELALMDAEDLVEGGSDEDDGDNFVIR